MSYIVLQALDDLDAVVAQIQLSKVHQALQTLHLGQPVALQDGGPTASEKQRGGNKLALSAGDRSSRRGLMLGHCIPSVPEGSEGSERTPDFKSVAQAKMLSESWRPLGELLTSLDMPGKVYPHNLVIKKCQIH